MNLVRTLTRLALGRRMPRHEGRIPLAGLHGPVTIRRDERGVPYIRAEHEEDAWFALGFCHGQDRAGQLEVSCRMVRGTLSAVAGADTLPLDRLSRRLGCRRAGLAQLQAQPDDIRQQLEAYARGINAGITRGAERPAHELALLRCAPTAWDAADVQGLIALICFALASNWDIELLRLRVLQDDGPDALAALDATYPEWLPVSAAPLSGARRAADRLAEDLKAFSDAFGTVGGSNAWAVSGARSATGRPLLANDPHMLPAIPSQWYLASVETPRWRAVGGGFVGVPTITCGHNGFAAWGVTAAHADNTDLFVEEIGPDGRSVRQGDALVSCEVHREVIEVKGGDPVVEEVLVTPRGPIVTPVLDGARDALSMSATWLAPRANRGLLHIHRCRTPEDFDRCFAEAACTNGGIVYANVDGDIGFKVAVEVPRRRAGFGNLPAPGWDERFGWDGVVPPEELPHRKNPEEGFVATANNRPIESDDGDGGPFLGVDWLDGYRLARIAEALASREDWDVASFLTLQTDRRSKAWEEVRVPVLEALAGDAELHVATDRLRGWDGELAAHSVEATLYVHFVAELVRRIVTAKAPNSAEMLLGAGATAFLPYNLIVTRRIGHLVGLLRDQPDGWFATGWQPTMRAAMRAVLDDLRARHGRDPDGWEWGHVRPLTLVHPFADKPPVDRLFNVGPIPCGGDATTVAQASVDMANPEANPVGVPTLRLVIDLGDWDASRFVLLGGQSGNPLSPHYDDQVELWEQGRGVPIHWAADRIEAATVSRLSLLPG